MDFQKLHAEGKLDVGLLQSSSLSSPKPCRDCGKDYLIMESAQARLKGSEDPIWGGCAPCWAIRIAVPSA